MFSRGSFEPLLVVGFLLLGCARLPALEVCFQNVCVKAEIADTDESRQRGLMFRESLAGDKGMLFIFQREAIYSFWMKNMRIPLDMIWIGSDKKVVDIKQDVPPCRDTCESLIPLSPAMYVLEVQAGFTQKYNIKTGDPVKF